MIISLDTETTGVDFVHGVMPFLVTTCDQEGIIRFWEWDVDPLTRRPQIPDSDLADIAELIDVANLIYLHNAKFDHRALAKVGIDLPWPKVRDTLVASHLLASNHGHRLDQLCIEYLGVDIEPFELSVKEVTQTCRAIVKRDYPAWRIAEEGLPEMPSVKVSSKRDEDKPWKNDMWLPRALVKEWHRNADALWDRVAVPTASYSGRAVGDVPDVSEWPKLESTCSRYANADSEHTLYLGMELERLIRERGLWAVYEHRLHLPRVACDMESYGITAIGDYTEGTIRDYEEHIAEAEDALCAIAAEYGHELELAEGASINDNMRDFFYGAVLQCCPRCTYTKRVKHWNGEGQAPWLEPPVCPKCARTTKRRAGVSHQLVTTRRENLGLPVVYSPKSHSATLDKTAMDEYLTTTEGNAYEFVKLLTDKRKRGTDLSYMESYRRFWVPVSGAPGYYRIHPSLNPCGTDHLRWASNSPNLQNVSVQEEQCEECDGVGCGVCGGTGKSRLSVMRCFGPAPGREWWYMDFRSIERRIPPYECGEPKMVSVFEQPDDPPYWGNLYYLTASVLYPEEFWPRSKERDTFKKQCPRLYKQAKFFDLAKQYGAGRRKGDLLSKVHNSYDLVDNEFPLLAALQEKYLTLAIKTGFVETLPDRTVDPTHGYPILASRTEDGRVLSTTPFNYHVSGTACWIKNAGLVRCANQCACWRAEGFDAHVVLEVHDSILFDFPRGSTVEDNLPRALVLRRLMEQGGEDLIPRIPTPVSMEYITESWAEGVSI